MKFSCYSYWKYHYLNNIVEKEDDEEETYCEGECPDCQGYGYQECDLGHEHDCEECNGTGKIQVTEKHDSVLNQIYKQEVLKDIKKYCDYVKNDPIERSQLYKTLSYEFTQNFSNLLQINYYND